MGRWQINSKCRYVKKLGGEIMKKLREEILEAQEKLNDAKEQYIKSQTKQNYDWWKYCEQYYKGLKRAFDLVEGGE